MTAARLATVLAAIAAGCANGDGDPARKASSGPGDVSSGAGKENHVFEVKSSADLQQLPIEYMRLWSKGSPGQLDVTIAPGTVLQPTGWTLEPEHPGQGEARIDVVIHGAGAVLPAPDRVFAHSLTLEDVVMTGARSGPSELRVSSAFTMRRTALIDVRLTDPNWQGGLLEIFADGGHHIGTGVTIEDCWFVRNFQTDKPAKLLLLTQRGEDAGYFDKVRVIRSAFLGNAFGADLGVEYAKAVTIDDSLFFRNWTGDGSELTCSHCEAVVVNGSVFALERAEQVAARERTQPVLLKGSRVLARDWKPGARLPPALDPATADQMAARDGFAGEAAALEAIGAATAQPLRLPAPDAFAKLARAFSG
jgi:hypothetical protein